MMRSNGVLLAGLLALAGCSENAVIQSDPIGAKVFINDRLIGITPAVFSVERRQFAHSYRLRLEKKGYEPYVGELTTRVSGSRATAAVFTLGSSISSRARGVWSTRVQFRSDPTPQIRRIERWEIELVAGKNVKCGTVL